jgi:LmbE family N-acetylglucosaminyl deacetylase
MTDPIVVFATDGAPADKFFWAPFGSREAYSRLRRQEALRGLAGIGIRSVHFLDDYSGAQFFDQQLHQGLPAAISALDALVRRYRPHAILAPAYEGGHPDHDACSFMGSVMGDLHAIPVWEMPLYHRRKSGRILCQKFRDLDGTEVRVRFTASELLNRSALIMNYASQTDLGDFVKSKVEYFRPQRRYNYTKPPHEGTVNYEAWGWPISATDVSRNFERLLNTLDTRHEAHETAPSAELLLSGDAELEQSRRV